MTATLPSPRSGGLAAANGLALRSLRNIRRLPSAFIPALLMPVVQVISFSGTYAGVTDIPGFPTDRSINWYLPLAVTMGASFAGLGTGFAMIRDLESGFYDRLRMAPTSRRALLLGPFLAAWTRAMIAVVLVSLIGLALGARPVGNPATPLLMFVAALGMATVGTGWGLGLAYRFRDMRAAAIMQLTLFLGLFLTDAQTPIEIIDGWLEPVATWNPLTRILHLARQGFVEGFDPRDTIIGVVMMVVLGIGSVAFALTGLARLDD
jgi:ABC-2 type transport system permease protein